MVFHRISCGFPPVLYQGLLLMYFRRYFLCFCLVVLPDMYLAAVICYLDDMSLAVVFCLLVYCHLHIIRWICLPYRYLIRRPDRFHPIVLQLFMDHYLWPVRLIRRK